MFSIFYVSLSLAQQSQRSTVWQPFPSPTNSLYLSLSLCSAHTSPLAPFKLIYALLAFCLLALNSIWRVFFYFCFVFCSAHHAMLAIATHRKPLTWVTLRYVALKCKAARPFTSTALHLAPLPFLSHLPFVSQLLSPCVAYCCFCLPFLAFV